MDKKESKVKKWFKDHQSIIIVGGTAVGLTLIGYILGRASTIGEFNELKHIAEEEAQKAFDNGFFQGSENAWAGAYYVDPEATKKLISFYRSTDDAVQEAVNRLEEYVSTDGIKEYFESIKTDFQKVDQK